MTPFREPRHSATPCPRERRPLSVDSAISAQVLALPTSIAVRKLPCWFRIAYGFLELNSSELLCAYCFAIAGLGFGPPGYADADFFFVSGFCPATEVFPLPAFAPDAAAFATAFFGGTLLPFALTFLTLALGAVFFATADFGSGFFSVNSKAGLGSARSCVLMRVISAAGFTPAAAAALAAEDDSAACRGLPSMSGLTITWLS